jgi:hypothetical protein
MNLYRNSIFIFGMALPLFATAIFLSVCYLVHSKVTDSFEKKQLGFKSYQVTKVTKDQLQGQVDKQHKDLERWNALLKQETASALSTQLQQIGEHFSSKDFVKTAFDPTGAKSGFANVSAQKSSQIKIAFRGTFTALQKAFLELETRMPQLQLQDLKIDPNSSQASLLNVQVNYTAWEN